MFEQLHKKVADREHLILRIIKDFKEMQLARFLPKVNIWKCAVRYRNEFRFH